ncbi:unnamed protein product [Onchocerca flexuosa]|uniref:Large ribosomal subunit protein eL13 n=1 Tax=Onchocerca flexuosa TaxID=387005 RepID=A0A183I2L3_9BILA|nr:unnamed protein product [Onchocerca flexuosa]
MVCRVAIAALVLGFSRVGQGCFSSRNGFVWIPGLRHVRGFVDWQTRVRTWFNQPARKERRRRNRYKKGRLIAPRPVAGLLRPAVRCPSIRYNKKVRLGRGLNLQADELKLATQLRGVVLPIKQVVRREKAREVTEEEKKFKVYCHLRRLRADKRLKGTRDKKAREVAEEGIGGGRR